RLNLPWERFTFIDVGCGKGRALLLAQRYRFHQLVGLEISPELAQIARENQYKFHAYWNLANPVNVLPCDAAEFVWPEEPSVLFLYHPFARPVMMRLIEKLRKSLRAHPRELYLLYANPELHDALLKAGFLVKLWDAYFDVAEEDVTADFFGERREHITAYRNI
ncbi:MAG TPA: class I SAM-dependent methyltransferase, partial [Acidobacteriaceae bacterium]|nr:class I SAM-dependent methyltransferase [Acidobacteriaceae bacterium]